MNPKIPNKVRSLFRRSALLALRRGERVFAVGGYVRDLVLGVPSFDVDLAVEGDGPAFARDLAEECGVPFETFTRFGTAILTFPGIGRVDVAATRRESYPHPGALPSVLIAPLEEDLVRRDFTLNSIALRLSADGKHDWIDPTGGLKDLRKGLLRAHHDRTFEDDPTRILRAIRFEQRFGFRLEPKTRRWLLKAVKGRLLDRVSGDRLRGELILLFAEPKSERGVKRVQSLGVWKALSPGLKAPAHLQRFARRLGQVPKGEPRLWTTWLCAAAEKFNGDKRRELAGRLSLSGAEARALTQSEGLVRNFRAALRWGKPSALHAVLEGLEKEAVLYLRGTLGDRDRSALDRYLRLRARTVPFLKGGDLRAAGWKSGPDLGRALLTAYHLQLDGVWRSRRTALGRLRELPGFADTPEAPH